MPHFCIADSKKMLFPLLLLLLSIVPAIAMSETAEQAYQEGMAMQRARQTEEAVRSYQRAIRLDPKFGPAHYEIGWSYWVLGDWRKVVQHWQTAKRFGALPQNSGKYLAEAQQNLNGKLDPLVRASIGENGGAKLSDGGRVSLKLVARFQHYNPRPLSAADHFDQYVFSPKSVRFLPDGSKAYVNALEGFTTIIYDPKRLARKNIIIHRFSKRHQALFSNRNETSWLGFPANSPANPNVFNGKPVESALTHSGKYLWVPYYRRDYDVFSVMPSAVAIIDTATDRIVRVMATGPIPKYVVASPDGKWLAVIHWGDNTVGLIDVSSANPAEFRHATLISVGKRIDLSRIETKDRDHGCGFCLRGAVFTADGNHLLVARMGGGGIAVINIRARQYIGTVRGMRPTPRHLELSSDGSILYLSSSFAGYVSAYRTRDVVAAAQRHQSTLAPLRETHTGAATRTIALSPDNRLIFAAVNKESKIMVLDASSLNPLFSLDADSYPVGMAVSPDGKQLWVTSQGRKRRGGNSVMVFRINVGGVKNE
jgi:DNA-binding beta-propeller fold protein YncE